MHHSDKATIDLSKKRIVLLVGNPNVGKSVIFNLLTGRYVTVSNYPGTTVELARGSASFDSQHTVIIDTPGINNLFVSSEDERVTRDLIFNKNVSALVQIADAKNLRRSLALTFQLVETGKPLILVLNIYDEARQRGIKIDAYKLSKILGIDVILTVATEKVGTQALPHLISTPGISNFNVDYGPQVEKAVEKVISLSRGMSAPGRGTTAKFLALLLLSRQDIGLQYLANYGLGKNEIGQIKAIAKQLQAGLSKTTSFIINNRRMQAAAEIIEKVTQISVRPTKAFLGDLSRLMLSPFYGSAIALAVLFIIYKFVGEFGAGTMVDFFESVLFGRYFNPWVVSTISRWVPFVFLQDLLVGEYGLVTMALTYAFAIILPIVSTFFIAFGILEDSGYLPRLSILMDRLLRKIGLHGKAVLPLVLGLGCDTMATLTTRILETRKERIIATVLLSLAIPCSAQLGVILGLLSAVSYKAMLIWLIVVLTTMFSVGFILDKMIKEKRSDFILEIPPLRLPQLNNILTKLFARLKWYLKEAVPLFFLGTFVLFILDKIGLLVRIKLFFAPVVVGFLGLPAETTEAFILGFLRRDYGAAGLYALSRKGALSNIEILVSIIVITLLVPCVAQFFVTIKERGIKLALLIFFSVMGIAVLVGGLVNFILTFINIGL